MSDSAQFKENSLVTISYPPDLRKEVASAASSWKLFCELPKELKNKFTYENNVGFELKEEPGANKDLKENFHVTIDDISRLNSIAGDTLDPKAIQFINDAEKLIELATPLITNFTEMLEKEMSLTGLKNDCLALRGGWTLRYIHYFGDRKEGEEIANAHADKGGFTLHLFESAPGLQYLDWNKNWQEMPVSEGQTVIIPAMRLQLRSKNVLKALCHRVVATKDTAKTGRYSIVLFVGFANTPWYNKDSKGRLQKFKPGFNYSMSLEEFAALFL